MNGRTLVGRGLRYYWRTNLAVVAGALVVGDSVRGSLRDLVVRRLGRADRIVLSADLFREQLADDLAADSDFNASFAGVAPLVVMQGLVTNQETGRRASRVQ